MCIWLAAWNILFLFSTKDDGFNFGRILTDPSSLVFLENDIHCTIWTIFLSPPSLFFCCCWSRMFFRTLFLFSIFPFTGWFIYFFLIFRHAATFLSFLFRIFLGFFLLEKSWKYFLAWIYFDFLSLSHLVPLSIGNPFFILIV